ncbi:MAG: hypothetical protein SV760_04725 [Halobacteria archaeon]|nr:hypothetical protein [Halobacteria archaeon]
MSEEAEAEAEADVDPDPGDEEAGGPLYWIKWALRRFFEVIVMAIALALSLAFLALLDFLMKSINLPLIPPS